MTMHNTSLNMRTWLCLLIILHATLAAYKNPGAPTGFVNDFTATLSLEQRQTLETTLKKIERETHNEITVALVKDLDDDSIENFAEKLFKEWQIGKKGADNGLLILVAPNQRKMRIEVGYGLEATITDAQSHRIINDTMKPAFRRGDFYTGITGAVQSIEQLLNPKATPAGIGVANGNAKTIATLAPLLGSLWLAKHWPTLAAYLLVAFFVLLFIVLIIKHGASTTTPRKHNSRSFFWFGGGDSNNSSNDHFSGFGGGGSGGGGNSGEW